MDRTERLELNVSSKENEDTYISKKILIKKDGLNIYIYENEDKFMIEAYDKDTLYSGDVFGHKISFGDLIDVIGAHNFYYDHGALILDTWCFYIHLPEDNNLPDILKQIDNLKADIKKLEDMADKFVT